MIILHKRTFLLKGIKFALIGLLGTLINISILYTLTTLGIWYIYSEIVAIGITFTSNYIGNIIIGNIIIGE